MPIRNLTFLTGEIYHVYNRAIDSRVIYKNKSEYQHARLCFRYYQFSNREVNFSTFLKRSINKDLGTQNIMTNNNPRVSIISYCLMPDHYHFLIQQSEEAGIVRFQADFQNSYTRYFNTKHQRIGPIFLPRFKAVRIKNENQFLHVNRYIHLNPYSAGIINDFEHLIEYPWSSLGEYLTPNSYPNKICDKELVMSHFIKISRYKQFILNQAGYQRSLKQIRKNILEPLGQ